MRGAGCERRQGAGVLGQVFEMVIGYWYKRVRPQAGFVSRHGGRLKWGQVARPGSARTHWGKVGPGLTSVT